ncbi:glioma pathogenesis-related protein 1 isoform X1 [Pseudonaja textilis]|uniref:GLI pathosis related 1 n=1 Tax=Pseudonaja textilis TaxID=8673 RepID=A0A670YES4_PSETE|nr:glioma pathogenesis-related protein 1 isoform X1 [Pseudonaja textilis]
MTEKSLIFGILLFLKLQVCCCFYNQHTLPDIENAHFIEECVRVHNRFRSNVDPPASNMKRMSWDHDLAKTALGWANMCQFNHNPDLRSPGKAHPNFTVVGENIWTGSIWYFNVTSALTNWYNEVQYYNYATQHCKHVCGHYTQMVWAKTYKVGCAVHYCPVVQGFGGSDAAHFICDYGPGGNYRTWPYKSGVTCSECYGEPCVDRLCGEVWVKKPYCDTYCIIVLVLRTSSFLITFSTVFFLKQHYPRMYMYK